MRPKVRLRPVLVLRASLLLLAAFALVMASGCRRSSAADACASPPPPEVQVRTVVETSVQPWDEYNGRIVAVETVELRPRVSGYIERVAFNDGQEVAKGQLLFVIDPRPYRTALATAEAQLARARAAATLERGRDRRAQLLVERNAVSREEAETRQAGSHQAAAQVRAAEADVARARLDLDFTEVRAPIAGRIGRALLTPGNLAQADQSLLTTLVSQDPVYVYFDADEHNFLRYARWQREGLRGGDGNRVRIGLADEEGFPHEGRLDFTDNQLRPGTGTIRLRAVLDNPQRAFTPGLFASVRLEGREPYAAVAIDETAILTDQDRRYVYVVADDGLAQRRDLRLGRQVDGRRVIESGLAAGDRLVTGGLQRIYYPGMPVRPVPAEPVATATSMTPPSLSQTPTSSPSTPPSPAN